MNTKDFSVCVCVFVRVCVCVCVCECVCVFTLARVSSAARLSRKSMEIDCEDMDSVRCRDALFSEESEVLRRRGLLGRDEPCTTATNCILPCL